MNGAVFKNVNVFAREMLQLFKSPVFLMLTFFGNLIIGCAGVTFYYIEREHNSKVMSMLDAIWWSFATATTTGYGDITPSTNMGKVLGICLMLIGTALFAVYTALFAEAVLSNDIFRRKKN